MTTATAEKTTSVDSPSNWNVVVSKGHDSHKVRCLILDKIRGVKALYCIQDKTLIKYLFKKGRGWTEQQATEFAQGHLSLFKKFSHIEVDQMAEFLKVVGERHDGGSEEYLPNSPSFHLVGSDQPVTKSNYAAWLHGTLEVARGDDDMTKFQEIETLTKGKNHRARVKDPGAFQEGSFRTIDIDEERGIKAIVGRPEGKDTTEVQAYLFDASKWTVAEAKDWLKEHDIEFTDFVEGEAEKRSEPSSFDVASETVEIVKVDDEKRLVYGVFLWPDEPDHDGDVISREDIEKVAHGFMADYRTIDEMHKQVIEADIVESAIAWADDLDFQGKKLKKGTWFGVVKVHDDKVWEKIKSGVYKGFSVRISGIRETIA